MRRREFIAAGVTAAASPGWFVNRLLAAQPASKLETGPGYASPAMAIKGPREKVLYTVALYVGTGINKPDYLATIDADPTSANYGEVIHRLEMPNVGDELHHFGWNACSSCHGDPNAKRQYLIVPGLASSRIHIIDVSNATAPKMHKVIEPEEIKSKTNLSAPHTVHCLANGQVLISMLGTADDKGPGGFLLLNRNFDIAGRWEDSTSSMRYNYDYWYQPRHNVMVSSEWAAPETYLGGFNPADVEAGKYGHHIHFWDWKKREIVQSIDLGDTGKIPLEVRFLHDPDKADGYVGAALSSTMWHWHKVGNRWQVDKVIEVEAVPQPDWPFPVPGLITDLIVSMDDRYLYFSNWLHGDIRQYDISNPASPKLTGQVFCGGVLGKGQPIGDRKIEGGPQMLQLSLDGRRLYATTSLLSSWDNQFYPELGKKGSAMIQVDCDTSSGGLKINDKFLVDFGAEPNGPARAHEIRYPGGDCTSDIFV